MAKLTKIATYTLGEKGVVITKSPVHGEDGELASAQNAVPNPDGGLSGLHKRLGFRALNAVAAAGPIYAFVSSSLVDPGPVLPAQPGGNYGRWLYTDDAGATWAYLTVAYSVATADLAPTYVGGVSLVVLHADSGGDTAQISAEQVGGANVWEGSAVPAAGFNPGRVPYVVPKCLSIDGYLYYWANDTGSVRAFDGSADAEVFDLSCDEILDWATDGTSLYVLVTNGAVQQVIAVLLADYSTAQFGADLDFQAVCIEVSGTTLYVGGTRVTSLTQATAVVVSQVLSGGSWAVEFEDGDTQALAGVRAYAFLGSDHDILSPNFVNGDTVTTGSKTYTFQTTLTNVDGNVQLGGSTNASLQNLASAINRSSGSGVAYAAAMTANLFVSAWMVRTAMLGVRAFDVGVLGNTIPVTSTANASENFWYTEGGIGTATLTFGAEEGTQLTSASTVTDLIAGTDVLYAAKSSTSGTSVVKRLQTATWASPRAMSQPFGYVAILAAGDEAVFLETPLDMEFSVSKAIALGSAFFWMIGTGAAETPEITLLALSDGAIQRIALP